MKPPRSTIEFYANNAKSLVNKTQDKNSNMETFQENYDIDFLDMKTH